jgi:hypothetical protein
LFGGEFLAILAEQQQAALQGFAHINFAARM